MPDAVAAGGIAEHVDMVGIDAAQRDVVLDEAVEHRVDVRLVPEVPRVGRRARRDVDPFLRFVEADLVGPLLVVDGGRRAAPAVE